MVNMNRLVKNLTDIAEIGRVEGAGISRMAYSEEFFKALNKLRDLADSRGYETKIDRVGNLFICYNPKKCKKYIMTGSHLDTVRNGGLYDGALGVFSAFEVLDTIKDSEVELNHGIIVVCFNAEEGSKMGGTFGSRTICGANNLEDKKLPERLSVYGLSIDDLKSSIMDFENIVAFVELHIEQGGVLDLEKLDIGVVEGIVEIRHYDLILRGTANHGGTTPMYLRDDPVRRLPELIGKLYELAGKYPSPFVMTIGDLIVSPGMYNIIPAEIKILLEARDLNSNNLDSFFRELEDYLESIEFKCELIKNIGNSSSILSEEVVETITEVVEKRGYSYKKMSSGAGHDSEEISKLVPTGMIFVPSIGGISHSPREYTSKEQIEKGVEVLLDTIVSLDKKFVD